MTNTQCLRCDHYRLSSKKCKAFPRGIPIEIFEGRVDHSVPYNGGRGIRFLDLKMDVVRNDISPLPKEVRIDIELKNGEFEHFSLANSETRSIKNYLVVPLPLKLRK